MNCIRIDSVSASQRTFVALGTLLFLASAALTIAWCGPMSYGPMSYDSMSSMHDMPMPGSWSMSMMWMRMPGQTWLGAVAAFLGMWFVMMIAMMLPSLLPMLARFRRAVAGSGTSQLGWLTMQVGAAYFFVWTLFGAAAFAAGATLTTLEMQSPQLARAVPALIGAIVLCAGALQFSAWKAHHLACCRGVSGCNDALRADARTAWRHGWRLGVHCVHCCFGLTVMLLVIGVMDLRAMAVVTAAISVERFAPDGARVARAIGVIVMGAGAFLVMRASCGM
jgi:predicted metal-binding membrane protein